MEEDRSVLRFANFKKAHESLIELVELSKGLEEGIMKKGIIDGVIQRYEFTFELLWKCLKEYIDNKGYIDIGNGPKAVLKFAFENGIIEVADEDIYLNMLNDRNITTHLYDEELSRKIYESIRNKYIYVIGRTISIIEIGK